MFELDSNYSPENTIKKPEQNNQSGFQKKPKKAIPTYPYTPVSVFIDSRLEEPEAKQKMIKVINALLIKGYTVRINGDDKSYVESILQNFPIGRKEMLEIFIPWKPFNDIESKHWYSADEIKTIAKNYISEEAWNKLPKAIHAFLARNIRMLFGGNNNSCCIGLIVWTPDGAETLTQIGRSTGGASHILKAALSHGIQVINVNNDDAAVRLASRYNLGG